MFSDVAEASAAQALGALGLRSGTGEKLELFTHRVMPDRTYERLELPHNYLQQTWVTTVVGGIMFCRYDAVRSTAEYL